MKTEKNLKLSFNLFRFFGWLTVVVYFATTIQWLSQQPILGEWIVEYILPFTPAMAYAMYRTYINNKKRIDPKYKVNMLNHYKSAYYTLIVTFALSLILLFLERFENVATLLLGVATYFASYLTIIAKSKNNQI